MLSAAVVVAAVVFVAYAAVVVVVFVAYAAVVVAVAVQYVHSEQRMLEKYLQLKYLQVKWAFKCARISIGTQYTIFRVVY